MIRLALALVIAHAGCYEPSYSECAVACSAATDCAPTQICDGDGWCVSPDRTTGCTAVADGTIVDAAHDPTLPDAPSSTSADATPTPDAPLVCNSSCPGECIAGVCVIRCMTKKSCASVSCPLTGACRIECIGKESCKNVACGTGPCTVSCSGEESCEKGVWCVAACACDVTCTGDDACHDRAICPSATCRLGDGCTSSGATCNTCG